VDVVSLAHRIEDELEKYCLANPDAPCPTVAVMGCIVNGPGEARHADIAVAGGKDRYALYVAGNHVATVPEPEAADAVMEAVRNWKP
jgi:(E)-4-hydroxy-3-methylbut-2-enyl-diphosphate synthase